MIKNIKYFFQAFLVYLSFLIARLIGINLSRKLFSFIFQTIGSLIKNDKIINKNLYKFSKHMPDLQKKEIISNMWSNYGMTFVEYVYLNRFKNNNFHLEIEGKEILEKISKSKNPVIFVSGHFANFELMAMEIEKQKINLASIYRPLNNFFLNSFMEFLRNKYICKNQIKKGRAGVKDAIEYINKNYSIALMIDQRVSEGEKIKFFSEDAYTTTLPAQLSIKYKLNIVPIFIKRDKNNYFKMKVYDPIFPSQFDDKTKITRKLNEILEGMIVKNPDQWIWTHNRWK